MITGVLRTPEPKAWYDGVLALTTPGRSDPHPKPGAQFFARDIPAMAAALDAPRPAPVMLSLESPAAGPKPDALRPADRHPQPPPGIRPDLVRAGGRCWSSSPSCGCCPAGVGAPEPMRYVSTRGHAPDVSFTEALLAGLAPDGGLYTPQRWPSFPTAS